MNIATARINNILSEINSNRNVIRVHGLLNAIRFYSFPIGELIDSPDFLKLAEDPDLFSVLLSRISVFPESEERPTEKMDLSGISAKIRDLAVRSYERDQERKVLMRGKLGGEAVSYELFESARPLDAIFELMPANPGKEISLFVANIVRDKAHLEEVGIVKVSLDEADKLADLLVRIHGFDKETAINIICPPKDGVDGNLLNKIHNSKEEFLVSIIGKAHFLGWDFNEDAMIAVFCASIKGVDSFKEFRNAIINEVGVTDNQLPVLSLRPDFWLDFVSDGDFYEKWLEDISGDLLVKKIMETVHHLLESPCDVWIGDLVSTISGAMVAFAWRIEDFVVNPHPAAMILYYFHDELCPYDIWDRTSSSRPVIDLDYRSDHFFQLVDSCISWHFWKLADQVLAFFVISEFVGRSGLYIDRRLFARRLELLISKGFGKTSLECLRFVASVSGARVGSYASYISQFPAEGNGAAGELDMAAIQAARNLRGITGIKWLCPQSQKFIQSAEMAWCARAHGAGVDGNEWGSISIDLFRAFETEIQVRYEFVKSESVIRQEMDRIGTARATGAQITKLIMKAIKNGSDGDLWKALYRVFPLDRDPAIWGELRALWDKRNTAAHGGAGISHADMVAIRTRLFEGRVLERFCLIFADS